MNERMSLHVLSKNFNFLEPFLLLCTGKGISAERTKEGMVALFVLCFLCDVYHPWDINTCAASKNKWLLFDYGPQSPDNAIYKQR